MLLVIELFKSVLPWIIAVVAVAFFMSRIQAGVKQNAKDIKKHDDLLTSGEAGGAPFITGPEHDRLSDSCRAQTDTRIKNIESDISEMKTTMKEGDECRKEARIETAEQFSALRKEFNTHYTDIAVLVGQISTKIEFMQQRSKDQ